MTLFTDLLSPRNENLIFFLYIVLNKKRKKLTGPNKVLLVLGWRPVLFVRTITVLQGSECPPSPGIEFKYSSSMGRLTVFTNVC